MAKTILPPIQGVDDFGITPDVQARFDAAAQTCRQAYALIEATFEVAAEDSDAARRCEHALTSLEEVIFQLSWMPTEADQHG